jgi:hypothetical protein
MKYRFQSFVSFVCDSIIRENALLTGRMSIEFFLLLLLLWHVFKTHMIKGRNVTKEKSRYYTRSFLKGEREHIQF